MKSSKVPSIRVFGQRPITSDFLSRSSNSSVDGEESGQIKVPGKKLRVSLSSFLDRKLQKGSDLNTSVKGKQKPFSSPVIGKGVSGSGEGNNNENLTGEPELNGGTDVSFEQLKHTINEKEGFISLSPNVVESSTIQDTQGSRKRRNPYEGMNDKPSARKVLVTLGNNKQGADNPRKKRFISNEKPKPLFNHYANGGGWWDNNMEGVDSDEVGCHEMWEGVGSTTLGGLEWH